MSTDFQTAVNKTVPLETRRDAINRLIASRDNRNLAVLVRTDGLTGQLRRQAMNGLVTNGATDQLEVLADDPSVPPSLRRRATEAV